MELLNYPFLESRNTVYAIEYSFDNIYIFLLPIDGIKDLICLNLLSDLSSNDSNNIRWKY